jgi:hypothetical protein
MSDVIGGPPPGGESPDQLRAKLQGLERMRVAGLVREQQYQETRARLQEQLDALGSAPAQPFYGTSAPAPAAPPAAPMPAPQPAAPAPYAPSAPAWQPRQSAADAPTVPAGAPQSAYPSQAAAYPSAAYPPPPGYVPPPPLPTWQPPQPGAAKRRRTSLIATGVGLVLIVAVVAGTAVVGRSNKPLASTATTTPAATPSATPTPTPTPDAAATLAPLRNAQPAPGQPLVTPIEAKQLVSAFWTVREQGLTRRNPDTIHAIEDGAAGEYDAIGCTYGCPPPSPRPLKDMQVMVPLQKAYPAAFMAQVLTTQFHTSDAMVEIIVFTRKAASAPWFISFDTYYTGVSYLQEFHAGPGDFDAPGQPNRSVDVSTLTAQLAAYWQHWKDTGLAPAGTNFAPGAFSSEQGLDTYHAWIDERAAGIADHTTYTAGTAQDGVWSFGVNFEHDGSNIDEFDTLTCGTVRFRAVDTPIAPVRAVVQDTSYEPFGDLLKPGEYGSVTLTGLHESCMLTQPNGPGIVVEGLAGSQTRVVGVPFSGSGVSA